MSISICRQWDRHYGSNQVDGSSISYTAQDTTRLAATFSQTDESNYYSADLGEFMATIKTSPKTGLDWLTRRQRMVMRRGMPENLQPGAERS